MWLLCIENSIHILNFSESGPVAGPLLHLPEGLRGQEDQDHQVL